ncbi:hypothetical protein [Pedobacter sp. SYP-B3415]|uniref:hypothetical protein n=1 Tax=Pedobacter sp. SYP-B3415 TaxID=2496641 RepID=UPI00101D2DF1|nr:hypothetical protein [Pedobacter sp. SYP-B3415]
MINFTYLFISLLSLLFAGCKSEKKPLETDCKIHLSNAKRYVSQFYNSNSTSALNRAVAELDSFLLCSPETATSANLRITALTLLEDYRSGQKYIETLNGELLHPRYKKQMIYNYFRAKEHRHNSRVDSSEYFLKKAISAVDDYLKTNPTDEEAYLDMFTLKREIYPKQLINDEIDVLRHKYPKRQVFFDGIREALWPKEKSARPEN